MSRPIGALLKEHAVLIAGIALPVLLILLFGLARVVPSTTVPDPAHEAVFAVQPYYGGYTFAIKDGKLQVTYTAPKDTYTTTGAQKPKIVIYNGATDTSRTITLEAPKLSEGQTSETFSLKEFENLKVSDQGTAPDGYEFRRESWNGSSVVTEIFSYNRRHRPNALVKDGRIIPVNVLKDQYYGDITFIGWVTQ
jgi:hypothetical protein